MLDAKCINKTAWYPSSSEGDGARLVWGSALPPRAVLAADGTPKAERCVSAPGQSPPRLCRQTASIRIFMAVKGTENTCVTNALLTLAVGASRVLPGDQVAPGLGELQRAARSRPTQAYCLACIFRGYFSLCILNGDL